MHCTSKLNFTNTWNILRLKYRDDINCEPPPAFTLLSCSAYSTLEMEAICSSETSADFQRTTRLYIPTDSTIHISTYFASISRSPSSKYRLKTGTEALAHQESETVLNMGDLEDGSPSWWWWCWWMTVVMMITSNVHLKFKAASCVYTTPSLNLWLFHTIRYIFRWADKHTVKCLRGPGSYLIRPPGIPTSDRS
jgi:hypothetical protein